MKKYLESLRNKPESHKKKVALSFSVGITALIALFWATSFGYFHQDSSKPEVAEQNKENSPLSVLGRGAANVYESITGSHIKFVKEEQPSTAVLEYVPDSEIQKE